MNFIRKIFQFYNIYLYNKYIIFIFRHFEIHFSCYYFRQKQKFYISFDRFDDFVVITSNFNFFNYWNLIYFRERNLKLKSLTTLRLRLIINFNNFVNLFNKFYIEFKIMIYQILFNNYRNLVNHRNRQNENLVDLKIN